MCSKVNIESVPKTTRKTAAGRIAFSEKIIKSTPKATTAAGTAYPPRPKIPKKKALIAFPTNPTASEYRLAPKKRPSAIRQIPDTSLRFCSSICLFRFVAFFLVAIGSPHNAIPIILYYNSGFVKSTKPPFQSVPARKVCFRKIHFRGRNDPISLQPRLPAQASYYRYGDNSGKGPHHP